MSSKSEDSDRVAKIMGSYLLKGYTLLDSCCHCCQTPLMRTRSSDTYCIYCNEIDVISGQKKIKTLNENVCEMSEEVANEAKSGHRDDIHLNRDDIQRVATIVGHKIGWASDRLKSSEQIHDCRQLTDYLKSSVDLLLTLNVLNQTINKDN